MCRRALVLLLNLDLAAEISESIFYENEKSYHVGGVRAHFLLKDAAPNNWEIEPCARQV
jgi:hypothetical protein